MKIVSVCVLSVLVVAGLAGCSASGPTVPNSNIAATTAKALQKETNLDKLPPTDCGTGSSPLVVGTKFNCVVTDPGTGKKYDTVVKLTSVKGLKYNVYIGQLTAAKS